MEYSYIKKYYQSKLKEHGPSAKGMDWKNIETQYLRFEVLSKYIDFADIPSVLDVGCGDGELNRFLMDRGVSFTYKGLDVVEDMVNVVNARFGVGSAQVGDITDVQNTFERFDYVVASGTFNAKLTATDEDWRMYFVESIQSMFACCNKAVIFNCMSQFVDWRYDRLYYPNIQDFSTYIVSNLSRRFLIDHSYPLFESTYVIYK